jgi:hypothetical protein
MQDNHGRSGHGNRKCIHGINPQLNESGIARTRSTVRSKPTIRKSARIYEDRFTWQVVLATIIAWRNNDTTNCMECREIANQN